MGVYVQVLACGRVGKPERQALKDSTHGLMQTELKDTKRPHKHTLKNNQSVKPWLIPTSYIYTLGVSNVCLPEQLARCVLAPHTGAPLSVNE